ncbi:MAG: hypothetical protein IPN53_02230 [Comamonadaceae bacterium]|nr:hypothetical protein [Comamonadaceae bacterium]
MLKNLRSVRLLVGWFLFAQGFICHEALAVYASPINAGCYVAAAGQCKIHVDPFTIFVATGKRLVFYQLQANGHVIYSFKTDVSNPPLNNYSPSVVMQDFAATCGTIYTVNLAGQDSGDPVAYNLGQTTPITCPASAP